MKTNLYYLDILTPYFKGLLENLSPINQEIFYYIALADPALTVSDLTSKIRDLDSKTMSGHLRYLTNCDLLKSQLKGKNSQYSIKYKSLKIWFIYRNDKDLFKNYLKKGIVDEINFAKLYDKIISDKNHINKNERIKYCETY